MKRCPRCNLVLSVEAFGRNRARPDGLADWCKECRRESRLRKLHDLTDQQYAEMLSLGGCCIFCDQPGSVVYQGRLLCRPCGTRLRTRGIAKATDSLFARGPCWFCRTEPAGGILIPAAKRPADWCGAYPATAVPVCFWCRRGGDRRAQTMTSKSLQRPLFLY